MNRVVKHNKKKW